jgi:triacylglycerol lipase
VSGGGAVTPYTSPDQAARTGLAAGNTLTAMREHLLERGHEVYTAPASIGGAPVETDAGWQGFSDAPVTLSAEVTINSVGTIDAAGESLHGFLTHLSRSGIDAIDLVAHSMGGLFSRAAIRLLRESAPGVAVRRLVTLGTPWTGALLGDVVAGDLSPADAGGDAATERILTGALAYAEKNSQGAADQVSARYLTGESGWNARQTGALAGVDVTVIAGDWFAAADTPTSLWPHDGLVSRRSALAEDVPADVLPRRAAAVFGDVHSIFFAELMGLDWERALTWDPDVFAVIDQALETPFN